jgi:hypothetical protein
MTVGLLLSVAATTHAGFDLSPTNLVRHVGLAMHCCWSFGVRVHGCWGGDPRRGGSRGRLYDEQCGSGGSLSLSMWGGEDREVGDAGVGSGSAKTTPRSRLGKPGSGSGQSDISCVAWKFFDVKPRRFGDIDDDAYMYSSIVTLLGGCCGYLRYGRAPHENPRPLVSTTATRYIVTLLGGVVMEPRYPLAVL